MRAGDAIVDTMMVRDFWHITDEVDIMSEANKHIDVVNEMVLCFMEFASEFIWKFCSR